MDFEIRKVRTAQGPRKLRGERADSYGGRVEMWQDFDAAMDRLGSALPTYVSVRRASHPDSARYPAYRAA